MTSPVVSSAGRFLNPLPGVIAWLSDPAQGLPEGTLVTTRVPANLDGLRVIWVLRRAGTSAYVTSTVRVEVHCFAADETDGWDLTELVHAAIVGLGGHSSLGQLYDKVRCPADPVEQFWSPTVFRTVALYELDARVVA